MYTPPFATQKPTVSGPTWNDLPTEIKEEIWNFASPRTVIIEAAAEEEIVLKLTGDIEQKEQNWRCIARNPIPAMLMVDKATRLSGLRPKANWFCSAFSLQCAGQVVYFDKTQDMLLFENPRALNNFCRTQVIRPQEIPKQVRQHKDIRSLALGRLNRDVSAFKKLATFYDLRNLYLERPRTRVGRKFVERQLERAFVAVQERRSGGVRLPTLKFLNMVEWEKMATSNFWE